MPRREADRRYADGTVSRAHSGHPRPPVSVVRRQLVSRCTTTTASYVTVQGRVARRWALTEAPPFPADRGGAVRVPHPLGHRTAKVQQRDCRESQARRTVAVVQPPTCGMQTPETAATCLWSRADGSDAVRTL